jgi:PAS domain S-box-containing protein
MNESACSARMRRINSRLVEHGTQVCAVRRLQKILRILLVGCLLPLSGARALPRKDRCNSPTPPITAARSNLPILALDISLGRDRQSVFNTDYRYYIGGIAVFLAQALLVIGLLWQRAKRRTAGKSLLERVAFESVLADLSRAFINAPDDSVAVQVEKGLRRVADFLKVERITLYEPSGDRTELQVSFNWWSGDDNAQLSSVQTSQFQWSMRFLMRGDVVLVSDLDALPEEASAEKEYLRQFRTVSVAAVPLHVGAETVGCMSVASTRHQVEWTEELVRQLNILADLFSTALRRKRTQAVLRESEERFRLMANTASILSWTSGADALCTYVNNAWLDFTGRTPEAELGTGWFECVHPDDRGKCLANYRRAFHERERCHLEYRLRRADGQYRWMVLVTVPRFDRDGAFAGYIGSAVDVTDKKMAEEALASLNRSLIEAQEQERLRIARELHDDINQQIMLLSIGLQSAAQLLPNSALEAASTLQTLAERTVHIGKEIQSISHRLHSSHLDYLGIVGAAQGFCLELSGQQKVAISFAHSGVPRRLPHAISLCLFRVLQEALYNAVKYSGASHFEVELLGSANQLQLTVSDSGVGFDVEAANNCRGLGLVSMRERITLARGTISIWSNAREGTKITACVPLSA